MDTVSNTDSSNTIFYVVDFENAAFQLIYFALFCRLRRCFLSCLLSWDIVNGEVSTFDVSQLLDQMKKSDKQVFEESNKKVVDLRTKYFIPCGLIGIQAFSNHTVFTGKSLNIIKHPFQPIAVVL